ncbi:MAG: phosphoenolpyruvate--protein phosphotransferase [Lachnospiraceae bacterium]|nr:phosphoenolpyruvate--protein phosphotransferase [Lachnospiraceae bacterium]
MILKGNGVSPGIALGQVVLYEPITFDIDKEYCGANEKATEQERFDEALIKAHEELDQLINAAKSEEQAGIFSAHKEILDDDEILEMVAEGISEQSQTAQGAVRSVYTEFIALVEKAPNPLIANRADDFRDVRDRLLGVLQDKKSQDLSQIKSPCILAAKVLLPSETAALDHNNILGIITEEGGATSHTAIIANSFGIPAVVGAADCLRLLSEGVYIGLDALTGEIYIKPDAETEAFLLKKQEAFKERNRQSDLFLDKPNLLADGTPYEIGVNIGGIFTAETFKYSSFAGVFRTEFLYMESPCLPEEEEQYRAYCRVLKAAGKRPVTLRTMDIGGDKTLPYMKLQKEENPFLGLRALRLCFAKPELLYTQLRAALRSALHGNLRIMLPMAGSIEDIRMGRKMLNDVKAQLEEEGIPFGKAEFGIMIEIPSIAAVIDLAVREVDFASIGTNDLCQYLSATDRMNPTVADYYQTFSPAMMRTLHHVISVFNKEGKDISVCGEMAGDERGALLLCGLGLRKFSMEPNKIAKVKEILAGITTEKAKEIADKARNAATQEEVLMLLG